MHNWRILDNSYLYDGSIKGLFSAVFDCIKLKIIPRNIISENNYQDNLLDIPVYIEVNDNKYNFILNKLKKLSNISIYKIYTAFLSEDINKDNIIFKYIISIFKYKNEFNFMKNKENLIKINNISAKVSKEAHRMKGFLRFKEIYNNIFYAKIEPENNVIEVLAKHFKERLKNEFWIIEDMKRKVSIIYNKKNYILVNSEKINLDNSGEEMYESLWKNYYKNISIKERKNLRCQMSFMPKKYWKHLIEMEGNYD